MLELELELVGDDKIFSVEIDDLGALIPPLTLDPPDGVPELDAELLLVDPSEMGENPPEIFVESLETIDDPPDAGVDSPDMAVDPLEAAFVTSEAEVVTISVVPPNADICVFLLSIALEVDVIFVVVAVLAVLAVETAVVVALVREVLFSIVPLFTPDVTEVMLVVDELSEVV